MKCLQMKPIILFLAVTAVATRANIFLDSSINSPSDRSWNVLALVQTITTEVVAKTLCYSVVPTDIFPVIQAFTPITTTIEVTISTIENPGNCRKRRWAFENAIDGRLSGPNDIIATSADANPRAVTLYKDEKVGQEPQGRTFFGRFNILKNFLSTATVIKVRTVSTVKITVFATCTPQYGTIRQC
ncbi:uncharacterized protein LOC136036090 isoform X2 [Artemia franciscana]|uniref:Uncharacterized protein n=1 Tax=Artemia franciscana TaxID=6661 RepID=A0AA88I3M1_ARTSF|nr:hypothetical protein QYM36_004451 [Artemia franciscana]